MKQFKLKFEKWENPILGGLGTIRTVPENYYVASVFDDQITFEGLEANTRDINQDFVAAWAKENIFN